ncbi:hypothetical protein VARIO8X_150197 [Burkholderiales bacterium 8X]|nr:hypothetical protein VARIO8X_150197 [Burkholderiales bacterium 8X]
MTGVRSSNHREPGEADAAKIADVRLHSRHRCRASAALLRRQDRTQGNCGDQRRRGLRVRAGHGLLPLSDAERRHIQGQPGVLAGRGHRGRGGRTQVEGRGVRGLRHARKGCQRHRERRRREGRLVQGQRGQHHGDHPGRLIVRAPASRGEVPPQTSMIETLLVVR